MKPNAFKIAAELPADAREDLFLAAGNSPGHLKLSYALGIAKQGGAHPMMMVLFARDGREPVAAHRFYQQ